MLDLIVIGGGQAGLAMGYYLAQSKRSFVILDGSPAVGHAWQTRYDSLRLFTPAQYNGLPGLDFPQEPDSYPTRDEVVAYLRLYAETFQLPIELKTQVTALTPIPDGYQLETSRGAYQARQVVIATGPFQRPFIPSMREGLEPAVYQIHSTEYRNPAQLPPGPVLVVGAGNSGAQIAEELGRERPVLLSVGKPSPYLPQRILGRDLFWWLYRLGLMAASRDSWLGRKMRQNDPLIGTDLRRLSGVELVGRTASAEGTVVTFADGRSAAVASVIWATGFRPDYAWIQAPVLGPDGWPVHRRGVTAAPGLYFLGLPWQHTRGSALLGGVGADAAYLAKRMAGDSASPA